MKIWILVGTRPEVIKQVPVYWACRERFGAENVKLVGTGQHRELLSQALGHFSAELDANLHVMKQGQSLTSSCAAILLGLDEEFRKELPDWIVVQGDTSSAAMAAIAAFHYKVKVAHNEAGLRSFDLQHPFPEEANRKFISVVADLHLTPTEKARQALLRESVDPSKIHVVGNPGIDALLWTLKREIPAEAKTLLADIVRSRRQPVLLTAHRRENSDERMRDWFRNLAEFLRAREDLALIYPMHPNNLAYAAAHEFLKPLPQAKLCEPFDYASTCHILDACRFVVTDSGGIQEEAATLGVPVVVCRRTTERSEAVDAKLAWLADPSDEKAVLAGMEWAYNLDPNERAKRRAVKPFGDGLSAARMAKLLEAP